jgi:hypothetical protein
VGDVFDPLVAGEPDSQPLNLHLITSS